MDRISRRRAIGAAAAAAAMTLGAPSVHAQKDRQTLRFVPQAALKVFNPIWTTAYVTRNHGYLVYDTLFGTDESYQIKPQMVDRTSVSADGVKYTFTLRDGLRWHDGQPVLSEDCVESLKRWGKNDRFGQLLMAHVGKIAPVDQKTFTLELAERFGPVLDALAKPSSNVPFMMPARIASTPADQQIKEVVGSGPFKFARDEWQPGEQAVYVRNPDYIPRQELPSGSTGGKKVYLDKVIWHYTAEPWDAVTDLAAGEVDWWEYPPLDFIPKIKQNPELSTFVFDPLGSQGWLRPNWLYPPFNNKKARQALLHMMDQVTYLEWAIGQSEYYRPCYSVFACGGPYATTVGAEPMMQHDLTRARQLVDESGYDGRPIVLLQAIDRPEINAAAIVTRQRLESIGFKVVLKAMDWSTLLVARARKEPPDKGGWNLLNTWWQAANVAIIIFCGLPAATAANKEVASDTRRRQNQKIMLAITSEIQIFDSERKVLHRFIHHHATERFLTDRDAAGQGLIDRFFRAVSPWAAGYGHSKGNPDEKPRVEAQGFPGREVWRDPRQSRPRRQLRATSYVPRLGVCRECDGPGPR